MMQLVLVAVAAIGGGHCNNSTVQIEKYRKTITVHIPHNNEC